MTDATQHTLSFRGHTRTLYSYGQGDRVVLLLNGGPGLPSLYLREPHRFLVEQGFRVVSYDQLDCGASDRPGDADNWTVTHYADELEAVLDWLSPVRPHVLGHSWGTFLAIETALRCPDRFRSLILADGAADIPHLVHELNTLRSHLGNETIAMMRYFEASDRLDHPAYQAAVTLLNYRHVCRLDDWPDALRTSLADWNMAVYRTMQGPNEFTFTGNYRHWSRLQDLPRLTMPTLVLCGRHDELTPACSTAMARQLPNARMFVFPCSSHMPFLEEPDSYADLLGSFLRSVEAGSFVSQEV
ncbi:putative hydrolase [Ameyamaea chiangmaiensis NBRC 103196]|uniref:Proline iminopeptidase-family hydrolase n=1 Tax=Ameyamaea chiangmaiensis TaxID=442969 RepID=A0A850P885_9PROT|nr:proline iminopeptidase-family hydrolase [Ameyamaea chiangmaiensis]MBS4075737.1 proline iminopeptidase-family hydrolase [Ameyamaea chiangmaiensis]NVN40807.1 proline iminopeptidase-family hydrolase [Ameyamaea chiangmaiensis]GBQ70340.1 putative hydrolase [Ameyamaea chiangmaiensis NBRC 103196]